MTQPPLPSMPEPPPRRVTAPAEGERFSRYQVKARRLCDMCIKLIHLYGQGGAPYPKAARWRRTKGDTTAYVCNDHKETRL